MKTISIHTKGVCRDIQHQNNQGGYGVTILMNDSTIKLAQGYAGTDNIRMELRGVIAALMQLTEPTTIIIHPTAKVLSDTFNEGWITRWQSNGWRKANKKPVRNRDLWQELLSLTQHHKITWTWAKGETPDKQDATKLAFLAANSSNLLSDEGMTTATIQ